LKELHEKQMRIARKNKERNIILRDNFSKVAHSRLIVDLENYVPKIEKKRKGRIRIHKQVGTEDNEVVQGKLKELP